LANIAGGNCDALDVVWADTVEPEAIDWLWEGFLAAGKITLLSGKPEVGKSQLVIDWIARITRNSTWPDKLGFAPCGSCWILSSEDGIADTIVPRLIAAGADMDQVAIIKSVATVRGKKRIFSVQDDLDRLGNMFANLPAGKLPPKLLMIDPITAYQGASDKVDSHRTTDVRNSLAPLVEFTEQHRISTVMIAHPRKGANGNAKESVSGSLAYVAIARILLVACLEPETDRRLLLPDKNNLGVKPPGRGYRIQAREIARDIRAPRILWDDAPVDVSADQALYDEAQASKGAASAIEAAIDFLKEQLADGPVLASTVEAAAKGRGVSDRTLRRAREKLGAKSIREDFQGAYQWALP
jgi:hypothetical protein